MCTFQEKQVEFAYTIETGTNTKKKRKGRVKLAGSYKDKAAKV